MSAPPLSEAQRTLLQSGLDAQLARLADLKQRYDAALATLFDRALAGSDAGGNIYPLVLDELGRWGALLRIEIAGLAGRCITLGSAAASPWQDVLAAHDRFVADIGERQAAFDTQVHKGDHDMGMKGLAAQRQTMERLNRLRQRFW
ncbi:MAG: hypothetical protein V4564_17220 [Pseudomonadota bacterium]|uniref:hypothetical protein n=1 Tax=Sphingomonas sp. ERG5 TaxID=1381597 RepID=UPI00054C2124|nr:hypothetical protein [Sphingomonas sp. ERG5]